MGRADMKFGILYNTDYYPAAHQSPSNYYAQLLEQTELAEKLGFDAVWFGEHHYSGYSLGDRDGRRGAHTADSPRHRSLTNPATSSYPSGRGVRDAGRAIRRPAGIWNRTWISQI